MATAKELYQVGDLGGAIEELTREVKSHPTDSKLRTFLFELLAFAGEWDRAGRQLDVLGNGSMQAEVGVHAYKNAIAAERQRAKFFSEGERPHFLSEPPAYVDTHIAGLDKLREGDAVAARELLDRAEEERPALPGTVDGQQVDDFRDADDLMAPVLEVFFNEKYVWIPFENVRRIEIARPARLRDLIWPTVRVETKDGPAGETLAPALYYGSSSHENALVRLGRMTDWIDAGEAIQRSVGLRMYLAGQVDYSMLEIQTVELEG